MLPRLAFHVAIWAKENVTKIDEISTCQHLGMSPLNNWKLIFKSLVVTSFPRPWWLRLPGLLAEIRSESFKVKPNRFKTNSGVHTVFKQSASCLVATVHQSFPRRMGSFATAFFHRVELDCRWAFGALASGSLAAYFWGHLWHKMTNDGDFSGPAMAR